MTSKQPSILSSRKVILFDSIEDSGFEPARQEQGVLSRPFGGRVSSGHDGDERAWQGRLHQRRGASPLSHIAPIRDFFLIPSNYAYSKSPLVHSFGMLMRKLWSHTRFSAHVSPHEVLQYPLPDA